MEDSVEQLERNIQSSQHQHRQSERSDSSSGYSMSGASTRRTRHRVDAGEPRGCFTSTYANNPLPTSLQSSSLTLGNSSSSSRLTAQSLADTYFTPMKMLTDFPVINEGVSNSSVSAQHAVAAANSQQKLLLREMLQKSQQRNNSIQLKSGYEESSEIELNKIQNKPSHQLLRINGCKKRKLYQPVRNQDSNSPAFLEESNGDVITTTSGNGMMMKTDSSSDDCNAEALALALHSNGHGGTPKGLRPIEANDYLKKRERDVQEGDHPSGSIGNNNLAKTHPTLHSNLLHTPPYLQQWKDTFKSTLVNHISDLIDIQFNLLFSSNTPPTLNPNLPSLHNLQQHQQHQQHTNSLQHEHNAHLMNGGSNLTKNHPSPTTNRYHSSRYNNSLPVAPPTQPHFSSALLALSQNYKNVIGDNGGGGGLRGGDRNSGGMMGGSGNSDEYCEDSPLSLVMTPKKKRHKVTDTRLTPRAVSRLLDTPSFHNSSPPPTNLNNNNTPSSAANFMIQQPPSELATSVAITNPNLNESRHIFPSFNNSGPYNGIIRMIDSPPDFMHQQRPGSIHTTGGSDSETGGSYDGGLNNSSFGGRLGGGISSSTLTPMHLRKAKLMFFWVRYPSSAVLKMYFPDIQFNKNNTAQLVKWFSNFREFYYIQMEKYARGELAEGVKNAEDVHVTCESEIYRVLNLHYNRNNHIEVEVPVSFRYVVEQTLREFFKAIQSGKDSEQSWKKAIYKIIARLDDPVPDYFKSPNFLEQLE